VADSNARGEPNGDKSGDELDHKLELGEDADGTSNVKTRGDGWERNGIGSGEASADAPTAIAAETAACEPIELGDMRRVGGAVVVRGIGDADRGEFCSDGSTDMLFRRGTSASGLARDEGAVAFETASSAAARIKDGRGEGDMAQTESNLNAAGQCAERKNSSMLPKDR
jgi:hypothetical protein